MKIAKKSELASKKQSFSYVVKTKENDLEIARRKQKISENPTFHDDIEFISEQLDLIKKQRDLYKELLEKYETSFSNKDLNVLRCHSMLDNNLEKHLKQSFDNEIIDPLSPSYGQELGDRIDKLNAQIKDLKQVFDEKSNQSSPLKKSRKDSNLIPSTKKQKSNFYKKDRSRSFHSIEKSNNIEKPKRKVKPTKSFNFGAERSVFVSEELLQIPYEQSFCNVQEQLAYFPIKIKELEVENKKLEKLLEKMKSKEMSNSTLSLDRPKHKKSQYSLDAKKKELELIQKQLEERSRALDLKEKELNMKETYINSKSSENKKKEKKKDSKKGFVNKINISNITNPERNLKSQTNISTAHYEDQNELQQIRSSLAKNLKNDDVPEKAYACKICKIF